MKTLLFFNLLFLVFFTTSAFADDTLQIRSKLGFGFQANAPTPGLSAKYEIMNPLQVQGIFGIFGDNTYYGGRLLYGFKHPYHTAYIFASVSGQMTRNRETMTVLPGGMFQTSTHNDYGQEYGGGIGLEWFFKGLPELGISIDVGFANYVEPPGTENFSSIIGGVGMHYYPTISK